MFKVKYSYIHSMTRFDVISTFKALNLEDAKYKIKRQLVGIKVTFYEVLEL